MRERIRDKGLLEDILEYSDNVIGFVKDLTLDDFISDKRTYYAVMKNIEIIGEASYKLTHDFKDKHPQTPWKIIQGMRHILVHDYAQIVPKILWDTAKHSIPGFRDQIALYLQETNWDEWIENKDAH